jgi:hypothetical protein
MQHSKLEGHAPAVECIEGCRMKPDQIDAQCSDAWNREHCLVTRYLDRQVLCRATNAELVPRLEISLCELKVWSILFMLRRRCTQVTRQIDAAEVV